MSLMCSGGGGDELTPEEQEANRKMNDIAKKASKDDDKVIKMLLLGAGESGKSTIFKQMKVINKDGYTEKERKEFKSIVAANTVQSMKNLLAAFEKIGAPVPGSTAGLNAEFEGHVDYQDDKLSPDMGAIVKKLWADDGIRAMFERRAEFQLNDSAEFYFNEIDRISTVDYIPTLDDVLRSRVRTTGIVQSDFQIKSMHFSMFDVGGQRNERRKWIHCFDNVDAVVFVAALSEFDQVLFEDETMNRMDEALDLFAQIVNSKWFKSSSLILFLNKKDLFETKLLKKNYGEYINKNKSREPYEGANEMKPCAEHCKKLFLARNKDSSKSIYSHITTAIDTSNVKFVFNAVVAMILEANLKASGLA